MALHRTGEERLDPERDGEADELHGSVLLPNRERQTAEPDGFEDGVGIVQGFGHDHEGDRRQGSRRLVLIRAIDKGLNEDGKEVEQ